MQNSDSVPFSFNLILWKTKQKCLFYTKNVGRHIENIRTQIGEGNDSQVKEWYLSLFSRRNFSSLVHWNPSKILPALLVSGTTGWKKVDGLHW